MIRFKKKPYPYKYPDLDHELCSLTGRKRLHRERGAGWVPQGPARAHQEGVNNSDNDSMTF